MMKELVITNGTVNRIMAVVANGLEDANYVRIDFGTDVVEDKVKNRLTISSKTGQLEVGFHGVADEVPVGVTVEEPAFTKAFELKEFSQVLSALAAYEHDMRIIIHESHIILDVDAAQMQINCIDNSLLLPVIKNRNNCGVISAWDKDIMIIDMDYKNVCDVVSVAGALNKRIENGNYFVHVTDAAEKKLDQMDENGNIIKRVLVSNAKFSLFATDKFTFAFADTDARVKKGIAKKIACLFAEKEMVDKVSPAVLEFDTTDEKNPKPVLKPYAEYKKAYDEEHGIVTEDDSYWFMLPISMVGKLLKLAAIETENITLTVGEKYIMATFSKVGVVMMFARPEMKGNKLPISVSMVEKGLRNLKSLTVSAADLTKAVKVQELKSSLHYNNLAAENPISMVIRKEGVEMSFLDAESIVKAIDADTDIEEYPFGVNPQYMSAVAAAFKKNMKIFYGGTKPAILFTNPESGMGNGIIITGANVEEGRKALEEKRQKALNSAAAKKAGKTAE